DRLGEGVRTEYLEAKLEAAWNAFRSEQLREESAQPPPTGGPDPAELLAAMPPQAREEGRELLNDPHLMDRVLADAALLGVAGEGELVGTLYLVGTSRLLEEPAAARIFGPTSSRKSYV